MKVFIKSELCLATKESYFIFNGLCYKQIDGEAMGSPLGPFLANAFLSYEKNWLNICPQGFKPIFFPDLMSMKFSCSLNRMVT